MSTRDDASLQGRRAYVRGARVDVAPSQPTPARGLMETPGVLQVAPYSTAVQLYPLVNAGSLHQRLPSVVIDTGTVCELRLITVGLSVGLSRFRRRSRSRECTTRRLRGWWEPSPFLRRNRPPAHRPPPARQCCLITLLFTRRCCRPTSTHAVGPNGGDGLLPSLSHTLWPSSLVQPRSVVRCRANRPT